MAAVAQVPDVHALRARFPALAGNTVFMENAGGSQVPASVIDAMATYMRTSYVQVGAGYAESQVATRTVEAAHEFALQLFGGEGIGHAVLGPSTSILCQTLAQAIGPTLADDAEIIVAETGHESNIGPWVRLGKTVRWWKVDPKTFECSLDALDELLNERTAIVAFPHVSNLLGHVVDVAEITRRAHRVGAKVVVDGVAYAPHRAIDVAAWGVDWYVFSLYKVYGPHMAALFGRREAFTGLSGPNHFFIADDDLPYKFELGGVNHEGAAGMLGLRDYLAFVAGADPSELNREAIAAAFHRMATLEREPQEMLMNFLAGREDLRVIGPSSGGPERVPTVSILPKTDSPAELVRKLDARGIRTRTGSMYAFRLCQALGITSDPGVIRISLVHTNTVEETDRLIATLR